MTTTPQGHLRAAGLPSRFTIIPFAWKVPSAKTFARTAFDENMKIDGWKTESVAKYYIGATSSGKEHGSERKCDRSYAGAGELPLSPEFEKCFAARAGKDRSKVTSREAPARQAFP